VNNTYDVGVQRSLRNLAALRQKMADINQRYLEWLDPIFLSLLEDGALESLSETTVVGMRRIPGIKTESRRLMAVVQSLPHFCNVPAGFTTQSLRDQAVATHRVGKEYTLSRVRYDLGRLRAKGLIERVPGRHHYRLTCVGWNTCALLTKLRSSFLLRFKPRITSRSILIGSRADLFVGDVWDAVVCAYAEGSAAEDVLL
jgi:hypothetical protein